MPMLRSKYQLLTTAIIVQKPSPHIVISDCYAQAAQSGLCILFGSRGEPYKATIAYYNDYID